MATAPPLPEQAQHEIRVVWVDPQWREYPYVREKRFATSRRTGGPSKGYRSSRLIGYAELGNGSNSRRGYCKERRMWVLHEADFKPETNGAPDAYSNEAGLIANCPLEGVLPESVAPGKPSVAAIGELRMRPRPVPRQAAKPSKYEHIVGAPRAAVVDVPSKPERPARDYKSSYLLDGHPLQMRAARLDAAIRAARRAAVECHSVERERARGGRGPSEEEVAAAQVDAAAKAYSRWWPSELARMLAEADFGHKDEEAERVHREKQFEWSRQKFPRMR